MKADDRFNNTSYRAVSDPDPVPILAICFAAVGMIATVSKTLMEYFEAQRRRREESRIEHGAFADVLIIVDRITSTGHQLRDAIDALQRDASVALSFSTSQGSSKDKKYLASTRPTFAFGLNPIFVSGSSREMWNLLVDDVCNNIRLINQLVLEYSEQLNLLFEKIRIWQGKLLGKRFDEDRLYIAMDQARLFQNALAKFQSLTAKTPLSRAQAVFLNLCGEAKQLVQEIENIATYLRHNVPH